MPPKTVLWAFGGVTLLCGSGFAGVAWMFDLPNAAILGLGISGSVLGWWIVKTQQSFLHHQSTFFMEVDFYQQVLALFKHHPKILYAFRESEHLIGAEFAQHVTSWIDDLWEGRPLGASARRFLDQHPHFVVGNLIQLMVAVELYGTLDYGASLDIIQDDLEEWIEDTVMIKQQERQQRNRIAILCVFSLVIAYFSQSMLASSGVGEQQSLTSGAMVVFFLMIQATLAATQWILALPWVEPTEEVWRS